jgi:hypothetical protein
VIAPFPGDFGGDARTGSCDFSGCLLGIPSVSDDPLQLLIAHRQYTANTKLTRCFSG